MKKYEEKTISTKTIFEGKIIKVRVDDVLLPNGETSKREIVEHPGAVAVLAVTDQNKIVLVEQYRKALEKSIIEIPAGKIEKNEDPMITAKRELEEETGYEAKEMNFLMSYYTSPGFADEIIYLYEAKGFRKLDNPEAGDEDEFVDVLEVSIEEALQLIKEQRIHDAKTIQAIYYLMQKGD